MPIKTLSLHTGHDASVALYEDYKRLFISKEERLDRIKGSGPNMLEHSLAALRQEHSLSDVTHLALTRSWFPRRYFKQEPLGKKVERWVGEKVRGKTKLLQIHEEMRRTGGSEEDVFDTAALKRDLGLPAGCRVMFYNHHEAHALPALFYQPDWDNAIIYTADGGGDFLQYSIYHFDGRTMSLIFGGDDVIHERWPDEKRHSLGQLYCVVTEIAGFKRNRHEGKITGLAAFGKPSVLPQLKEKFSVREDGVIRSTFDSYDVMEAYLKELATTCSIEDLARSAQVLLEDLFRTSFEILLRRHRFSNAGLSGGVFSNVLLNQVVSEIPEIQDVFVVPPMGDEGLPIGGVLKVMITERGFDDFLANRHRIGLPYWGDEFPAVTGPVPGLRVVASENIVEEGARLIADGSVCAIFTKGMEYGPRALGARSILINPADRKINDSVNKRLSRTEFMPFAPYVREERAAEVFEITPANRQAMDFMTITTKVKPEWIDRIPAVVHVDHTARPQIVRREDNPLYYDLLKRFEELTGLPCLVNTSFNAHEEPIINTMEEAFSALRHNRIDYLITESAIFGPDAAADGIRKS